MNINIGTECKECGARLNAEIMPTNDKAHILLAVELCDCKTNVSGQKVWPEAPDLQKLYR